MFNSLQLDLIVDTLPDTLKEAAGQGDHEGVLEEVREEEEAGAAEQDASQPEVVGALREEGAVVIDREAVRDHCGSFCTDIKIFQIFLKKKYMLFFWSLLP